MICRDTQWWDSIANHPEVAPHVFMGLDPVSLGPLVENPKNQPMRSENGGIILICIDGFGLVKEMHTLYNPAGWGREVAANGKLFMREAFKTANVIFTHEQEGNWRSRPPRSHGWKESGDYTDVDLPKRLKLWMLTRDAFYSSPVGRKLCPQ